MAKRLPGRLLALLTAITLASAQQVIYFTGAIYIQNSGGTQAVPAVCPAGNPISCNSISAQSYCCPTNNYCTWANAQVACCPNGQTCSGWSPADGAGAGGYGQPTSTWQPASTTYAYVQPQSHWHSQPATTAGYVAPAGYQSPASTPAAAGYGQYCSTLYAQGPNLPTTAQGDCGTILVEEPGAAVRYLVSWTRLVVMVGGLQVLGGMFLVWR